MPPKGSEKDGPLVVELVGPLIDDGGAFTRTLAEVLLHHGVMVRPGSLEQVGGAGVDWAVATLLEGHGRSEEPGRVDELADEVRRRWVELAAGPGLRPRPDAIAAIREAAAGRAVAIVSALPQPVVAALTTLAGLEDGPVATIIADGEDGLPRPALLSAWLAQVAPTGPPATALLASAPALLAAIGARCGDVVLVGDGGSAAAMLAERHVATVAEGLA